jgi:hypothetical protein
VYYLATIFSADDPEQLDPDQAVIASYLSSLPTSADWTWADPVWRGRLVGYLAGRRVASLRNAAVGHFERTYRRACAARPWLFELGDPGCSLEGSLEVFLVAKAMVGSRILSVGPAGRIMVPLLDLINHDACGPNIWYLSDGEDHFELTAATCSQETPKELLIGYAEHMADPAVSLLSYGFDSGALARIRDGQGLIVGQDRFHIPVLVEDDSCSPERHLLLSETSTPSIIMAEHGRVTPTTVQAWHVATAPCRTISDHLKNLAPGEPLLQLSNPAASRINISHVMDALEQYIGLLEAIEDNYPLDHDKLEPELQQELWYPAALKIYERLFIRAQRKEAERYFDSLRAVFCKFFACD